MKGFVGVILGVDLWLIEPLLKVIGGRTCKKKSKSMLRSAINVNDLRQIYTSQVEPLTHYLVRGHSLNGA